MPLALTWTSGLGSAPYRDCSVRIDAEGRSYWAEPVTFDDGVDASLWALSSRGQVRRSRDVKIRHDACKEIRRAIVAAYRERIEKGAQVAHPESRAKGGQLVPPYEAARAPP